MVRATESMGVFFSQAVEHVSCLLIWPQILIFTLCQNVLVLFFKSDYIKGVLLECFPWLVFKSLIKDVKKKKTCINLFGLCTISALGAILEVKGQHFAAKMMSSIVIKSSLVGDLSKHSIDWARRESVWSEAAGVSPCDFSPGRWWRSAPPLHSSTLMW